MNDLDVADSSGHEPITVKAGSLPHGFYDALAGRASSCDNEEYRRGYVIGQASPGEPAKYTVIAVAELNSAVTMSNTALVEQLRRACVVAFGDLLAQGMPRGVSTGRLLEAAIVAAEVYLAQTETEEGVVMIDNETDLFVAAAKTPAQKQTENLANFFEHGPGLRRDQHVWIIAKNTPKDMVLRGGLGAIGVGQAWMAATASDRDNLEYAAAPEIALWTRRDLARAAWTMAGMEISGFDIWWPARVKAMCSGQWGCPPLILAIAAWNGARGRDSLVVMPPEDGAAFEQWYGGLSFEIIDETTAQ